MYQDLSIITVAIPLSADLMIMSCLCLSWCNASRSVLGRLSHTRLGLEVNKSRFTALRKALSASSLLVRGVQTLLGWKGLGSSLDTSS